MIAKRVIILGLVLLGIGILIRAFPVQAYSYGPACQWIHLMGEVVQPPEASVSPPYLLTVTYQFSDRKHPAHLLINEPLANPEFAFYFAGFKEKIQGVHLISPMFFFAKEITFRYFVRSQDGRWRSPTYQTLWTPTPVPIVDTPATRAKSYRCHTKVALEPLIIEKRPLRGVRGL